MASRWMFLGTTALLIHASLAIALDRVQLVPSDAQGDKIGLTWEEHPGKADVTANLDNFWYALHWPQTEGIVRIQIDQVRILWRGRCQSFKIEVSGDNKTWKQVFAGANSTANGFESYACAADELSEQKYVRISATPATPVSQIEFWGCVDQGTAGFNHPGILLTTEDLDFIGQMVRDSREPWKSAFAQRDWRKHCPEVSAYGVTPFDYVAAGGSKIHGSQISKNDHPFEDDACKTYMHALMWRITGNEAYARNVAEGIRRWHTKLQLFNSTNESFIARSLFQWLQAAEITRSTWKGWSTDVEALYQKSVRELYLAGHLNRMGYVVLLKHEKGANHQFALVRAVLACGVYLNDRYTFNRGVALWQQYAESTLRETGQIAETLRDVPHCHCLLALQVEGAEIAWHQGLDLYAAKNHGLKSALELHAALCMGMLDKVKNKLDTSWGSRTPEQVWGKGVPGEGFAAYEIGYNHFANRLKMDLPLTTQYLQKARPIYTYRGTGTAITLTYQQSKPQAQPPPVPARPSEAKMPAPPVPPLMQPSRAAPATGKTGATNQPPRASKRGEE